MAKLTFNAILVICTGNICRSPIGERLLRRLLPAARVDSAGTCGLEGRTADSQATEIAAERGTLLEGHVARRLTPAMVRRKGTDDSQPRCIALAGEVGVQVGCTIYDVRPSPCREFDVEHAACNKARQRCGLVPL